MLSCWKWTAGSLTLSCILFGLPLIIYYQVVKPKNPTFTVNHASVNGFNLTSDGRLTSFFDISLRADNTRNQKLKLKYRPIRVSIFKDKQNLGTDTFPGFTQPKRNITIVRVRPVSIDVTLKKGPAFNFGIESGMGYLTFDVFMTAKMNSKKLRVNCRGVTADLSTTAHFSSSDIMRNSSSISCSVRIYDL